MEYKLERKIWWRFLKVLYGLGWVIIILITIFVFLITKPSGSIQKLKSGFTCPDGESYVWSSYGGGYYTKDDKFLESEDHISALKKCGLYEIDSANKFRETALERGFTENEIAAEISRKQLEEAESNRTNPPYTLNWVTDENGNKWFYAFLWTIVGFIVVNLLLDTLRNIILYIILGRPFSYPLLKILFSEDKNNSTTN